MQVVDAVIDSEPGLRDEVLAAACGGDSALREEAEKLLAHHTAAGSYLDESPFEILPRLHDVSSVLGQKFGPSRVTEEIGGGGMGVVYKAVRDDEQYERKVAIKLIKRGMDSEAILRRFVVERQILANLNHPNVARLLDGGITEDGRPYFVMEYIEGEPIDRYCAARKLATAERLKLFRIVCKPVQYAHQNLVVHRDIKPSNILVTADGTPKLLDFGIAKLLQSDTGFGADLTATELRVMTPEYASPEQVRGEPITTASDIYSLGVLLYELLTGRRPYHFKSHLPEEVRRVISEAEPEKPSAAVSRPKGPADMGADHSTSTSPEDGVETRGVAPQRLSRRLRGDLDKIVLKALRKEPLRRYTSVEQFSEDIRRHLEGLPVSAQNDTFKYRTQKFVRRHSAGVLAASLVVVALIGGMAATLWQARVARAERAKAERRFNDVRKLANMFVFDYHDAIATLPNSTPVRQRLVKDALEYLDRLAQEAGDDPSLQRELAAAYLKVGEIQGGTAAAKSGATISAANLGDSAGAAESFRKALVILERLVVLEPGNRETREQLADAYAHFSDPIQSGGGDPAVAYEYLRKAAPLYEELLTADPSNKRLLSKLSIIYNSTATALYAPNGAHLGDLPGAIDYQRRALAINRRLSELEPANAEFRQVLAASYGNLGSALLLNGNHEEALDNQRKAADVTEALVGEFGTNLLYKRELAVQYSNIGKTLLAAGDKDGAVEKFIKARDLIDSVSAADPSNADYRRLTATAAGNLADGLAARGERGGALENYEKAYQVLSELKAKDEKNLRVKMQLGATDLRVSTLLLDTGDAAGAVARALRAVEIVEPLAAANPNDSNARRTLASSYAQLGKGYAWMASRPATPPDRRVEHCREANDWYQKSLSIWAGMREKGQLTGMDAAKPEEIRDAIAKCGAAPASD
jgi:non-specific serine/threonine protein kinase/serine/threonine-protein kinase